MAKAKWNVWIDKKAFSDGVLKGEGLEAVIRQKADEIQKRAGVDYKAVTKRGVFRSYAVVVPATPKGVNDNLKNNTLLKALGG